VGKSFRKFVGNAKYLKTEHITSPVNTSILWLKEEDVTAPGKGTETKLVLYFDGLKKGVVLNMANAEALAWSQSEYFVRNITFYRADAAARSKPDAGPKRPDPAPLKQRGR
jgi:hypothetical protein